jgi:hypothetical protein
MNLPLSSARLFAKESAEVKLKPKSTYDTQFVVL